MGACHKLEDMLGRFILIQSTPPPPVPLGTACGAHIELAPHGGLVDALKGAVFRVLTAGEVEELVQGSGTGLGVPCPFHREVLGESWGRCGVDTR